MVLQLLLKMKWTTGRAVIKNITMNTLLLLCKSRLTAVNITSHTKQSIIAEFLKMPFFFLMAFNYRKVIKMYTVRPYAARLF